MDTILTQIAKTNILMSLNTSNKTNYHMSDIKEITFWSQVIEIETRDEKIHHIPLKIG